MITRHDESLFHHQAPVPAIQAATSDHRFFDRLWYGIYDPAGDRALMVGMGVYKNMDVVDAFAVFVDGDIQTNLRLSRPLSPDFEEVVGPLRVDVIEPLQLLHLVLDEGKHGLSFDLLWRASAPPMVEKPQFYSVGPRIMQDYCRWDQVGFVDGTIRVAGAAIPVSHWTGLRDRVWGTRPGVGGFEPDNGNPYPNGLLYQWMIWGNEDHTGYIQIHRDGDNRPLHTDGLVHLVGTDESQSLHLLHGELDVTLIPDTRAYARAVARVSMHDGTEWTIVAEPLTKSFTMHGSGYDRGYEDGLGHGVRRPPTVEWDQYDLTDLTQPRLHPSGEPVHSFERAQPARITVNDEPAIGHCSIIPVSPLRRHRFDDGTQGHDLYGAATRSSR